jgi:adenosylcobinamide-GDP ribazoletransferase
VLFLLLKYNALIAAGPAGGLVLLIAPALARWGLAIAIYAFPYARPKGLGRDMKDHTTASQVLLASLFAVAAAWLAGGWLGLVAGLAVLVVVWAGARFSLRLIPGLTGDVYGALTELAELAVLLVFAARVAARV